jgi:hypothetical protein
VCKDRTTVAFKKTDTVANGYCGDSINQQSSANAQTCSAYAAVGCDIADADASFFICVNSTRGVTSKKCENKEIARFYRNVGDRCDTRTGDKPDPKLYCKDNAQCVDNVCRPKLKEGEQCLGSTLSCGVGLTCDGDYCRKANSRFPQEPCKSNQVCISGKCDSGFCSELRSIPCYSNTQCNTGVCYIESGKTLGFCTSSDNSALATLQACARDKCSGEGAYDGLNKCAGCETELVRFQCAQACIKRVDRRTIDADDGFMYNCQTMTRTAFGTSDCSKQAVFTGCPAVAISGSVYFGISAFVVVLCVLIGF